MSRTSVLACAMSGKRGAFLLSAPVRCARGNCFARNAGGRALTLGWPTLCDFALCASSASRPDVWALGGNRGRFPVPETILRDKGWAILCLRLLLRLFLVFLRPYPFTPSFHSVLASCLHFLRHVRRAKRVRAERAQTGLSVPLQTRWIFRSLTNKN
jgi:hypothetical protein